METTRSPQDSLQASVTEVMMRLEEARRCDEVVLIKTKKGGLGRRVAALEKTIEDTKQEIVDEEESFEIIRRKLEEMDMEKSEISTEEQKLKREKQILKKEEQRLKKEEQRLKKEEQTVNIKRENLVQIEFEVELDSKKIKESMTASANKLGQQEQELRALLEEGISGMGGGAGLASQGGHIEFLLAAMEEKERSLECPVCFSEASAPIFGCSQFHVVCGTCRADGRLATCPTCREAYGAEGPGSNRFAEERAADLARLRGELERVTS